MVSEIAVARNQPLSWPAWEFRSTGLAQRQRICMLDASVSRVTQTRCRNGEAVGLCRSVRNARRQRQVARLRVFRRAFRDCIALPRSIIRPSFGLRNVNQIVLSRVSKLELNYGQRLLSGARMRSRREAVASRPWNRRGCGFSGRPFETCRRRCHV